jgi:pimeloyl-ACP methyl ester carboxylesterase
VQRIRRLVALVLFALAIGSVASDPAARRWRAAALLLALSTGDDSAGKALNERELWLPGRRGPIRARLYQLAGSGRAPGLVVSHGVHHRGIDERRLVPFSRALARAGLVVLTPELDDLTDYRITLRGLEVVTDSASWLSSQRELVSSPRVGLLGFSFAGGLSLIAAAEPELEGRLAHVTSVGGHHDLSRVLRFLLSDRIETPSGQRASKAHEYGLIVLLYQNLEAFVDEPDLPLMREAVRAWLQEDRPRAIALASRRALPESEALFSRIESGRLRELAPALERQLDAHAADLDALSPALRLSRITAPVYLLHGTADSVIPPSETEWAARELEGRDHAALVSPLLEHVEVSRTAGILERALLVDFMARLL